MLELYTLKISDCVGENNIEELYNMTSSITQDKVSRYRFIEDKKRTLYADLLVRSIIIRLTGVNNRGIRFITNQYGKPYYVENNNLFFNISHSGDRVLCGFSNEEIGVDIELMKNCDIELARRYFTQDEYEMLIHSETNKMISCFYSIWCAKESYIKYMGLGLSLPLGTFYCDILTGCIFEGSKEVNTAKLHELSVDDSYKAYVCCSKKLIKDNISVQEISMNEVIKQIKSKP